MDDNLAGDGEKAEAKLGACGLYREVPVKSGAPTSGSAFAARQAQLGSRQPDMISSNTARGRLGKPGR